MNEVMSRATQILHEVWGYSEFRGPQAEIIAHVANGGDALVLLPTGGGKSLCYQIPSLVRDGMGVVVSPLIALMQDQVAALREAGVRAEFLNSSLSWPEQQRVEKAVRAGEVDILYVAPERLVTDRCECEAVVKDYCADGGESTKAGECECADRCCPPSS